MATRWRAEGRTAQRAACAALVALAACGGGAGAERGPGVLTPAPPVPARQRSPRVPIAVTLDDLPFVGAVPAGASRADLVDRLLAAARDARAPLTGFVVGRAAATHPRLLARWARAAALGNHSATHRSVDAGGADAFLADVADGQARLLELTGVRATLFRYPYLQTGAEPARRARVGEGLAALGLRRAPVTIDTSDWALVDPYVRALEAQDRRAADDVAAALVAHVRRAARRYRELAAERGHPGAPQILLLHANALVADRLAALLTALRDDGFHFVDLDEALAHPMYARPDSYVGPVGLSWLYRIGPEPNERWAWDAAQLHALQVRFANRAERPAYDLDVGLHLVRIGPGRYLVRHEGSPPTTVEVRSRGAVRVTAPPSSSPARRAILDWIEARFGPQPGLRSTRSGSASR
ncbi:MAG: polysaccharide deacetylase family protein [Sandaracinaceae bacterium]